jgi:nitrogen fixation NifU-like protein
MESTLYSEKLLDHFSHPRNAGDLADPDWTLQVENPICGDQLRLSIKAGSRIEAIAFRARGCTASIACGSALTELLLGRSRAELAGIGATEVEAAVGGLIPESKHAAVLCADAVRRLEKEWK